MHKKDAQSSTGDAGAYLFEMSDLFPFPRFPQSDLCNYSHMAVFFTTQTMNEPLASDDQSENTGTYRLQKGEGKRGSTFI